MKILVSTFLACLFCVGLMAQNSDAENQENDGPQLTLESATLDYGTIERGSDGVRSIKFTNTGNKPLIITNARGSCGCTVPSHPKGFIQPGESDVIEVKYDTKRMGAINKSVTISSNAGDPVRVNIRGKVVESEK